MHPAAALRPHELEDPPLLAARVHPAMAWIIGFAVAPARGQGQRLRPMPPCSIAANPSCAQSQRLRPMRGLSLRPVSSSDRAGGRPSADAPSPRRRRGPPLLRSVRLHAAQGIGGSSTPAWTCRSTTQGWPLRRTTRAAAAHPRQGSLLQPGLDQCARAGCGEVPLHWLRPMPRGSGSGNASARQSTLRNLMSHLGSGRRPSLRRGSIAAAPAHKTSDRAGGRASAERSSQSPRAAPDSVDGRRTLARTVA